MMACILVTISFRYLPTNVHESTLDKKARSNSNLNQCSSFEYSDNTNIGGNCIAKNKRNQKNMKNNIHETAITSGATIAPSALIKEYVVLRAGAKIGANCVIHPFCVIESGVVLGSGVEVFSGSVVGKPPSGKGALARIPEYELKVKISDDCSIGPNAVIYYDVEIGKSTLVGDGASIRENCRIGSNCIIARQVTINYNATIGDRTKIMDLSPITGNSIIGDDVFVSLLVGTTNDRLTKSFDYSEDKVVGPTIENGVTVGAGSTLLPGVRLGEKSTIAVGSIVNRDVEAGATVAGSPARRVKRQE
jgi:acetyltransferase-like isoleucine patch superfamily enzyme